MKKPIVISLLISLTLVLSAHAQTSPTPTVEELQKQIQLLLSQVGSLKKEVTALRSATPAPNASLTTPVAPIATPTIVTPSTPDMVDESQINGTETAFVPPPTLTHSLFRGSRGEDVKQLQEFLAQDPTIYPDGNVSGYYGASTEAAVKRWQAKNGVPAVGIVGRQTIAKFKEIYSRQNTQSNTTSTAVTQPITSSVDTTPIQNLEPVLTKKIGICPDLPTVDACSAGEERVVTYKSDQCGVYYGCKPRISAKADNTIAVLKKISSIQTDNRYNVVLQDPEGIQKFSVYNSKGAEIYSNYPACRKEWTSPNISADTGEFPLKLTLTDCASSQYSTVFNTSVVIKPILEGLSFPYKFSNGKIVYSSEEARSYCYSNGPGSGQGIAAECESKFGVVYTNTITTTTSSSARAIYSTDSFAACMTKYGFGAESKQIKTWTLSSDAIPWSNLSNAAQTGAQKCESEYYGQQTIETGAAMCGDGKDNDGDGFIDSADPSCAGFTTTTTPTTQTQTLTQTTTTNSNWVSKIWNFKDGQSAQSYILNRTDAEYANYIAPIQAQCLTINKSQFVWKPNAGSDAATNWQSFGIPDCSGAASTSNNQTTTVTYPAGQKEQTWNSLGLKSWIRTDADATRIEQLKSACANVPNGANIWTPAAGTSSSVDFGMPSADKCRVAATCTTNQHFDGASCVTGTSGYSNTQTTSSWPTDQTTCSSKGYFWCSNSSTYSGSGGMSSWCQMTACSTTSSGTTSGGSTYAGDANSCPGFAYSRWDSSSRRYCQLNNETRCDYNYPSYLTNGSNYTAANCPASTPTGSNTSTWCSPLGSDWSVYGSYCLNSSRTQYTSVNSPNSSSVQSCTGTDSPVTGCTPPGSGTTGSSSGSSCGSGYYWSGSSCVSSSSTTGSSCSSNQYWNGTACVTSNTSSSSSCSTPGTCFDSATCGSSGWYWYNGSCWSSPQSTTNTSSSCPSGQYWNGSSCVSSSSGSGSSCTSTQYWNGTSCVTMSSGSGTGSTSCPSGQYWNGSSCTTTASGSGSTTGSGAGGTSCPSGQWWNGTACVSSPTPSASVYDQLSGQLKSMEIILRGLLGR